MLPRTPPIARDVPDLAALAMADIIMTSAIISSFSVFHFPFYFIYMTCGSTLSGI
jgi:hypothetical protein